MLPEQCAAGAVYDRRLQRSCEKVYYCHICTFNGVYGSFLLLMGTLSLFRSSKQNVGIGLLGALTDLFDNLQKHTANTHKIITQLGISRGTV